MKISIFTPTNDPKFLMDLYASIKDQDFYEWVIVPNGQTISALPDFNDARVKIVPVDPFIASNVGALKAFACSKCTGDVLLEVDHDDMLTGDAIEEVKKAFLDLEVGFVYSNFAEFRNELKPNTRYNETHGWNYRQCVYKGHALEETVAFNPFPASVSRIWYAPNHLRAWRKDVYDAIGGHNKEMRVLDDQDIIARTYLSTKMCHIDKCLYLYRVHGGNAWLKYNAEIQAGTMRLYDERILDLAIRWANLNGLKKLDLGGAFNPHPELECVDIKAGVDLNERFPYADNSVGVIRANDILEHLKDKLHVIKEIYRVLAPGGYAFIQVPSALSQGGYQDPTHISYYVENSFKYYTEERFAKYIDTPVRFQAMRLVTTPQNPDGVSWIVAHLVALKGQEVCGVAELK